MRQIINIKDEEVIIYEITDQYLFECHHSKYASANKELCLNYLNKCEFDSIMLDQTQCIFSKDWITHFETHKTDGNWIWSGDLEYYFEKYNFIWPEDHLDKIMNSNYKISKESKSIIEKRNDLGAKLYNYSHLPSRADSFKDLIVQHRKITRIKLNTIKAKNRCEAIKKNDYEN